MLNGHLGGTENFPEIENHLTDGRWDGTLRAATAGGRYAELFGYDD
jgi:hypothetical protein